MALIDDARPQRATPVALRVEPSSSDAPEIRRPTERDWDELAAVDPVCLPSQGRRWTQLVTVTTDAEDLGALFVFPDGSRLLLPMVGRRWPTGGVMMAGSMPSGWGYGGVLGDMAPTEERLVHVWRYLTGMPALRIRLRPNPLHAAVWARSAPPGVPALTRRAHLIDLRNGFDEVWARRASPDARSNVRRAERLGVEVSSGADARHRSAYRDLLLRSRARWADQHREPERLARWRSERSDPWSRIEAMIRCTDACRLWIAWHGGAPAAAIVVAYGRNAHYTRGVMDRDLAATTRANDLLQRTAIEHACRHGCDWYHMGESGDSRALGRFKERFGARPHEYAEYLLERVPLHAAERACRNGVKRMIGYRDD